MLGDGLLSCFVAAPAHTVDLLVEELHGLKAAGVRASPGGVFCEGDLLTAYRVCMWSRVGSRVLLQLGRWPTPTYEALYRAVQTVDWSQHLRADQTFVVSCSGSSPLLPNSHYAALKVKDAVADQFRARGGQRPSVELRTPDLYLDLHLSDEEAVLSLDLSGPPLHRRGWRAATVAAPLKENLAAALLLRAGWKRIAAHGGPLLDPMCGSGTLLVEAALIAGDGAPGLLRERFGFGRWRQHRPQSWAAVLEEARRRWAEGCRNLPTLVGLDADPAAVDVARQNVRRAGLEGRVGLACAALADGPMPQLEGLGPGLVAVNPPYGERLGGPAAAASRYADLGNYLRHWCAGWRAAVLVSPPEFSDRVDRHPWRSLEMRNGPLPCRLLLLRLPAAPAAAIPSTRAARAAEAAPEGGQMFANRLRRNLHRLGRWARQQAITCYRLYDADMPEYAMAIDVYRSDRDELHVHVQEYQAPSTVDPQAAAARLAQALAVLPSTLGTDPERVYVKTRQRQRGRAQYHRLGAAGPFHRIAEGPCSFLVNFTDYLDTGLFLDHRRTRALVRELAAGRHMLNLFGYTGTASVYAALGAAASTTTVDMSRTYLDWAARNLALNGIAGPRHRLVRADCLAWLRVERAQRWGLIFLDPPTFSNSKRMASVFDVQRDHVWLLERAADLLEPEGVLIFATNCRRFRMETDRLSGLTAEDITCRTIPEDFARNPRIHSCWLLRRA